MKLLGTESSLASPVGYYLGAYAGSWVGGGAVGYVVARTGRGAATGGLAASGFWSFAEGVRGLRSDPLISAGFLGLGAVSLFLAWRRR
jgi:hypothetical protein